MKNIYGGNIDSDNLIKYFKAMIGRIYKLLPMKEEKCLTLEKYLEALMNELAGGNKLLLDDYMFIMLLCDIQILFTIEDLKEYKSQVFKCIKICEKIIQKLDGDKTNELS